jgi:hypothetical protein
MNFYFVATLVWLVFTFLARTVNDKANKILDNDKKATLIDLVSENRTFSFVSVITIFGLFFLSVKYELVDSALAFVLYFVLLISSFSISSYLIVKKLKAHQYPNAYVKSYLIATGLRFFGVALFVGILLWSIL